MTGGPDWFARTLALVALALTLSQTFIAWRRDVWRRRASNSTVLRDVLDELVGTLGAAGTPQGAANLWTGTVDVAMRNLREELPTVPDRKLTRRVNDLHDCLVSIRGMATPTNGDLLGPGVSLTDAQRRLLEKARQSASEAVARINAAVRRGGKQK